MTGDSFGDGDAFHHPKLIVPPMVAQLENRHGTATIFMPRYTIPHQKDDDPLRKLMI